MSHSLILQLILRQDHANKPCFNRKKASLILCTILFAQPTVVYYVVGMFKSMMVVAFYSEIYQNNIYFYNFLKIIFNISIQKQYKIIK
jgi:hypothetical protein